MTVDAGRGAGDELRPTASTAITATVTASRKSAGQRYGRAATTRTPPRPRRAGVPRDEALCAVRFSLSPHNTVQQIQTVLERLPLELAPLMTEQAAHSMDHTTGVFA